MDRDAKRKAEVERLHREIASLDRDWARVPYLLFSLLLTIPAGLIWGWVAAQLVLICAVSLVGTAAYLIGVRRREYRGELEDLTRDLMKRSPEAKEDRQ